MLRKTVSVAMLVLLVITTLAVSLKIQTVEAQLGTYIVINADGTISPPTSSINTLDNVTYAFLDNVYEAIAVQRSNIFIDGNGHTLTPASGNDYGFNLSNVDNVTITNVSIIASQSNIPGFLLANTNDSQIVSNNITGDPFGITYKYAISLTSCFSNNVSCNRVTGTTSGIILYSSGNNIVSNNHFERGIFGGVLLYSSNNNTLTGNYVSGYSQFSGPGGSLEGSFELSSSDNNKLTGNDVTGNGQGIYLKSSHNNVLIANDVTENVGMAGGGQIYPSLGFGIRIDSSSNNTIYHNNFIGNIIYEMYNPNPIVPNNVMSDGSPNMWDDGYPSGGNFWSDYNGRDANLDGIGDTPYFINAHDSYPLMGMFSEFKVTYFAQSVVRHTCNVTVISNSSISDFAAPIWIEHPEAIFLEFNVTGEEGSAGFCRVSFPTDMMNGTYHVFVSGTEVLFVLLPCSNADYSYLYFTYTHSTKEVVITPEFPIFFILPLFMIAVSLVAAAYRRKKQIIRVAR